MQQTEYTQSRVKCLLVDDLEENLLALSALLRRDDVELLTARSGFEALELLLLHDVALAFLDVQMPDMDGFELAELIRGSERTRNVPLIFVTAGTRDQHRMFKGYETGAVDFLYKPIDPHILKSKADVFFQLYQQKQQLAHELQQRTETLRLSEMFMAVLGHDLRNPLSAIVTSAHILEHGSEDQMVKKTAARMLSSGKRMSRMIEDMLDLARARLAGGIPLKREHADLGTLVQRVAQEYLAAANERRVEVQQDGDLAGEWDADRLAQVASNLIGNALQHGDAHEAVQVRLNGTHDDVVSLSVANSGRIPADVLPHIFDPFRGAQREAGRNDGLGLGLYIVQQIVNAHGGSVEVRTEEPDRTLFLVKVPRRMVSIVKL
ncbi:MAG: Sensor protein [Rhodocyclales bacterium]|nr:Sensor protein [Rhodocyclales bacterium]